MKLGTSCTSGADFHFHQIDHDIVQQNPTCVQGLQAPKKKSPKRNSKAPGVRIGLQELS